jgi:UDP:flavonoid glycosyltransferase YjiC (YdhE family)
VTRYLFATVPAAAHVNPGLPIARELVARGHEVGWLTGQAFRATVEQAGARFEPLVHAHDPERRNLVERFPDRAVIEGLAGIRFGIRHVLLDEISAQVRDLHRVLARSPADVVVADAGFMGVAALPERGGPPWATIGPITSRRRGAAAAH